MDSEKSTKATDGDIRARLLLSLNSKDACGLCIIRPQEVQEAADEIERLRTIEKRCDEIRALRDKNGDENPHEGRRTAFYIITGRWPTW